jgi:hypothetical protein
MIFEFGGDVFILLRMRGIEVHLMGHAPSPDNLPSLHTPAFDAIEVRDEIFEGVPGGPQFEERPAERIASRDRPRLPA